MTRAEIDAMRAELNHGLGSADYGYISATIRYGKTIDDELSERGLTAVSGIRFRSDLKNGNQKPVSKTRYALNPCFWKFFPAYICRESRCSVRY